MKTTTEILKCFLGVLAVGCVCSASASVKPWFTENATTVGAMSAEGKTTDGTWSGTLPTVSGDKISIDADGTPSVYTPDKQRSQLAGQAVSFQVCFSDVRTDDADLTNAKAAVKAVKNAAGVTVLALASNHVWQVTDISVDLAKTYTITCSFTDSTVSYQIGNNAAITYAFDTPETAVSTVKVSGLALFDSLTAEYEASIEGVPGEPVAFDHEPTDAEVAEVTVALDENQEALTASQQSTYKSLFTPKKTGDAVTGWSVTLELTDNAKTVIDESIQTANEALLKLEDPIQGGTIEFTMIPGLYYSVDTTAKLTTFTLGPKLFADGSQKGLTVSGIPDGTASGFYKFNVSPKQ